MAMQRLNNSSRAGCRNNRAPPTPMGPGPSNAFDTAFGPLGMLLGQLKFSLGGSNERGGVYTSGPLTVPVGTGGAAGPRQAWAATD